MVRNPPAAFMSVISATPDLRSRLATDAAFRREHLYRQVALARIFDERVLQLFDENELFGTTHCSIGQEADAVGVLNHLEARDVVWSSHRCHAHFLAWSDRPDLLMAELMGRATGVCGGRGGGPHLCFHNFYSHGVPRSEERRVGEEGRSRG